MVQNHCTNKQKQRLTNGTTSNEKKVYALQKKCYSKYKRLHTDLEQKTIAQHYLTKGLVKAHNSQQQNNKNTY